MGNRNRQEDRQEGSMLLSSLMIGSVTTIVMLALAGQLLGERQITERIVDTSRASQAAHGGLEYALWQLNYRDTNLSTWGWTVDGAGYRFVSTTTMVTPVNNMTVPVTMTIRALKTGSVVRIWSDGLSANVTRGLRIDVPASAGGGGGKYLFDHAIYAYGQIYIDGRGGPAITIDGYDSTTGATLPADQVKLGNDYSPALRKTAWDTTHLMSAGMFVFDSNDSNDVLNASVLVRAPVKSGAASPYKWDNTLCSDGYDCTDASATPGIALHANRVIGSVVPGAKVTATGVTVADAATIDQDRNADTTLRTAAYYGGPVTRKMAPNPVLTDGSAPRIALFDGATNPFGFISEGDVVRVCPGDQPAVTDVTVTGFTLVLGCSATGTVIDGTTYTCSDTMLDAVTGMPQTCSGSGPVILNTGNADNIDTVPYVLTVGQGLADSGKMVVASPTEIYYEYVGTAGGFDIASGGIVNAVLRGNGNVDPSALTIYGAGSNAATHTSRFRSGTAATSSFHGTIFTPGANVYFVASAGKTIEFYGSMNVNQLIIDDFNADGAKKNQGNVQIHWDKSIQQVGGVIVPGAGGGSCGAGQATKCKPDTSTMQMCSSLDDPACS